MEKQRARGFRVGLAGDAHNGAVGKAGRRRFVFVVAK